MYILTLEINQKCNLKCRYCYLGEKNGSKMTMKTAFKGIDLAFEKVKAHRDKKLWIDFVGGEAFLDFPMMKDIVNYIEKKNETVGNILQYSVTTNATIFSGDIIDYLADKGFSLKISIDGNKDVNDRNRIAYENYSVHDKIISQLNLIREFEKKSDKIVQVTNVVTNNNFENYSESVKYLVMELGFRLIDTGFDHCSEWNSDERAGLEREIRKVFEFFVERIKQGNGFRWTFAESIYEMKKERKKFYSCGAGIVSSYVRHNGSLFACPGNLDETVLLGNLDLGFDQGKIEWLKKFEDIENEQCHNCEAFDYCVENSCVAMSIAKTGNPHQPAPMLCWMRLLKYKMYTENEEILSNITM